MRNIISNDIFSRLKWAIFPRNDGLLALADLRWIQQRKRDTRNWVLDSCPYSVAIETAPAHSRYSDVSPLGFHTFPSYPQLILKGVNTLDTKYLIIYLLPIKDVLEILLSRKEMHHLDWLKIEFTRILLEKWLPSRMKYNQIAVFIGSSICYHGVCCDSIILWFVPL